MKTTTMKWMGGLAAVIFCLSVIAPDASAELVGYWNFDDNVLDQTTNGNDGELRDNATYSADTPPLLTGSTKSVVFDGSNDLVVVTQNTLLPINTSPAFTVAMWVKQNAGGASNDRRIFSEGSSTNDNPLFNLGTDNNAGTGKFDLFVRNGATLANHINSIGTPFDGEWHHIAWVDVNNGGTREGTLYIDGVADPQAFSYADSNLASDTTTIGGILRGTPCCVFDGNIDDPAIWNEALTPAAIEALAAGGSPQPIPEPSTFVLGLLASLGLSMYARRRRRA